MGALSKLYEKCKKCKYKDDCNDKRMVACAMAEFPPTLTESASMPMVENISIPIAREHTPITINIGGRKLYTSLEKINKRIEENLYKQIRCGFNETL